MAMNRVERAQAQLVITALRLASRHMEQDVLGELPRADDDAEREYCEDELHRRAKELVAAHEARAK